MEAVRRDDEVDRLYWSLHEELVEYIQRDPNLAEQAVALLLVGTYLERVADHITNIGERIWFIETGASKSYTSSCMDRSAAAETALLSSVTHRTLRDIGHAWEPRRCLAT